MTAGCSIGRSSDIKYRIFCCINEYNSGKSPRPPMSAPEWKSGTSDPVLYPPFKI